MIYVGVCETETGTEMGRKRVHLLKRRRMIVLCTGEMFTISFTETPFLQRRIISVQCSHVCAV